jgi:hypothetical protein
MKILKLLFLLSIIAFSSCSNDNNDSSEPNLVIKFNFDANQARLNNIGQPSSIPSGIAVQSPIVNRMSANYIEFAPTPTTLLGDGEIVFKGDETTAGGSNAINFQNALFAGDDETFLTIPLSEVTPGSYQWV